MGKARNIILKTAVEISRILLGITFIFSGFAKGVDPLGTAYKIQDYLTSFGLVRFHDIALPMSIVLCAGEFCLGIFMLLGLYRKWTSRFLFAVMLFMTPLTLYLAIANPVKDCGCFGDAVILTNWETFFKNIILLACSVVVLIWHQKITNLFTGKFYWFVGLYIIVCSVSFCFYYSKNEPIIDFRPYRIGGNIPQLMTVEEGKAPVFENVFIYEKNGIREEFTEDNYPWEDSTWVFVDRQSKLIKTGEEPLIHDFSINRLYLSQNKSEIEAEEDITSEVLSDSSYTFLMIAYSLSDMNKTYLNSFEDINNYARDHRYKFYCLTSSPRNVILQQEKENITNFDFCLSDERSLKTIVRSNPGLILIKNGVIINKWSDNKVPSETQLNKPIELLSFGNMPDTKKESKNDLYTFALILFTPLIVIKLLDALIYHRKSVVDTEK